MTHQENVLVLLKFFPLDTPFTCFQRTMTGMYTRHSFSSILTVAVSIAIAHPSEL